MKNRIFGNSSNGATKTKPRRILRDVKRANIEGYSHDLLKKIGPIRCVDEEWYRYEHGVWKEVKAAIFLPIAWETLNERRPRTTKEILDAVRMQSQIRKEDLYGAVRIDPDNKEKFLINCVNGVVQVNSSTGEVKLVEHNRKYMFTLQIESSYFPEMKCPRFIETLHETLPAKENRVLLLDVASSCLMPDSRFAAMLFCTGSGGNGKSTIWEAIARSLGESVVSRINYHTICANDRKYVWKLERMLLNLGTETQGKPIGENAIVKAIVCGEAFDADKLYESSFRMKTNVKMVFATNYQIRYEQGSEAEVRRTRIIHFGKRFQTTTRGLELERVLTGEKDGIFSMLVRRLAKTIKKACLGLGDKLSQSVYNQFRCSNNPVLEFVDKCICETVERSLSKQNLWECYKKFAKKFEYSPYSSQAFFRKLYQNFPAFQLAESRIRIKGTLTYVIRGITFSPYGVDILNILEQNIDLVVSS